eukprot:1157557-Pelagomonas_calceolata.AAC.4
MSKLTSPSVAHQDLAQDGLDDLRWAKVREISKQSLVQDGLDDLRWAKVDRRGSTKPASSTSSTCTRLHLEALQSGQTHAIEAT